MSRRLLLFLLAGCSAEHRACDQLCRQAGFPGGHATPGGHPYHEPTCFCDGEGDGLTQEQCDDFCAEYDDPTWPHGPLEAPGECACRSTSDRA